MSKNSAFVFIKPHAVTDKAKALVKAGLAAANINVRSQPCLWVWFRSSLQQIFSSWKNVALPNSSNNVVP